MQATAVGSGAGLRSLLRHTTRTVPQLSHEPWHRNREGLSHVDDLLKAKKMAQEFGGAEKLVNAISALVELQ
jgi:hypothetical protein